MSCIKNIGVELLYVLTEDEADTLEDFLRHFVKTCDKFNFDEDLDKFMNVFHVTMGDIVKAMELSNFKKDVDDNFEVACNNFYFQLQKIKEENARK